MIGYLSMCRLIRRSPSRAQNSLLGERHELISSCYFPSSVLQGPVFIQSGLKAEFGLLVGVVSCTYDM